MIASVSSGGRRLFSRDGLATAKRVGSFNTGLLWGEIAPPTKVQNFLISAFASFLRKKGEVDPVYDPNLIRLYDDLVDQCP